MLCEDLKKKLFTKRFSKIKYYKTRKIKFYGKHAGITLLL